MTAPIVPVNVVFDPRGMQPQPYGDLLDMLNCSCVAGGLITPSSLPSATIHLGDIVSEISKFLQYFTSVYKVIAVILKIIACIIDIICALPDPFQTIAAVIRFFTVCFPELLALFPQFAILLLILCLIKIILSIVVYIITVLIPMIMDIIENLKVFRDALTNFNADSASAVSFKILSLFEELRSLLAILALLMPIIEMIKALLAMGIGIPCMGGGGSCDECNTPDPRCPPVMQNSTVDGTDGCMLVLYTGKDPTDFDMIYSSSVHRTDFITMAGFLPKDVNYEQVKTEDELAYVLSVNGNKYAVTRIDTIGNLYVDFILPELVSDGYLSSVKYDSYGNIPIVDPYVRFASETGSFTNLLGKYITIQDSRGDDYKNSGTWQVSEVYDEYNVMLTKSNVEDTWTHVPSTLSPTPFIYWRVTPETPPLGCEQTFSVSINHPELIRHNMISLGCIPVIKETVAGVANRFPEIVDGTGPNLGMPPEAVLPDVEKLISDLNNAMNAVIPAGATTQYIYDNYAAIEEAIPDLAPQIIGYLESFQQDTITYAGYVMPRVVDVEKSTLDANPKLQLVGEEIDVDLVIYDRSGYTMGKGLPQGMVMAEIYTTAGDLSDTEEVIEDNVITGRFKATLRSQRPTKASLSAKVFGKDVSYFDGLNLIPKTVEVEFVDTNEMKRRRGVIEVPEPLGSGKTE